MNVKRNLIRRSNKIQTFSVSLIVLQCILFVGICSSEEDVCRAGKPNIIFIMADDAGWNDFSFHGSPQIPTPNIDALALSGIVLNRYYGSPLCTPTRGAVMTGKHPIHLRLQHFVVMGATADGLPLNERLMPQYLKDLGYSTHLVGKWHLGHSRKAYTPTYRGFDSHYGYWIGKQDYYDHFSNDGGMFGYDFRSNLSINFDVMGKYDTDLFTNEAVRLIKTHPKDVPLFLQINHIAPHSANPHDPLQAPITSEEKFNATIPDMRRRKYAAMVDKLDESVGLVVEALAKTNMLQNSIIFFGSDNGAAVGGFDSNYGSNWPLRGVKNTLWEGGTRLSAFLWSPFIQNRVSFDVFHAQDWLPTLYEAAGCNPTTLKNIDGVSLWKTFTKGEPSPRQTLLYNIDDMYNNSAIMQGSYKLIQGNTSSDDLGGTGLDYWYGPSGREEGKSVRDLIPLIKNSYAGKALEASGFILNETQMEQIQKEAEIACPDGIEPIPCNPYDGPCLFKLDEDPCEKRNLAQIHPEIVAKLLETLNDYNKTALSPIPRVRDPDGFPMKWGNVWTTFKDNIDEGKVPGKCDTIASRANSIFSKFTSNISFSIIISFGFIGSLRVNHVFKPFSY